MHKYVYALSLVLVFTLSQGAQAQNCDAVLIDGVMAKSVSQQSWNVQLAILIKLTQVSVTEGKQILDHTGQVGYGPLSIGPGTWNKDSQQQLRNELTSYINVNEAVNSQSSLVLSSGDPEILKAWSGCIDKFGGLTLYLTESGLDYANLEITWTPHSGAAGTHEAEVRDHAIIHGEVLGGQEWVTKGTKLGFRAPHQVTLKRFAGKDLIVVLNTLEDGGKRTYLPPLLNIGGEDWTCTGACFPVDTTGKKRIIRQNGATYGATLTFSNPDPRVGAAGTSHWFGHDTMSVDVWNVTVTVVNQRRVEFSDGAIWTR